MPTVTWPTVQASIVLLLANMALLPVLAQESSLSTVPELVWGGLNFPVSFRFIADNRMFFSEKDTGRIRVIENGQLLNAPFVSLLVTRAPEHGLHGIELDSDFASNGVVYAYYTYLNGSRIHARITKFSDHEGVGKNPVHIFDVEDPTPQSTEHNGGYIKFGPDGKLYVQVGEFKLPSLSQNLSSNAGKILRMNPDGSPPSDNPFPGSLIYAYGIRNGFGMDFDPFSGRLIATEAGPEINDEINFIEAGGNYGWPEVTGTSNSSTLKDPILVFSTPTTPTGIAFSSLQNVLYFGEYNTGSLKRLTLTANGQVDSVVEVLRVGSAFEGIVAVERFGHYVYFSTPTAIYRIPDVPAEGLRGEVGNYLLSGAIVLAAIVSVWAVFKMRSKKAVPARPKPRSQD